MKRSNSFEHIEHTSTIHLSGKLSEEDGAHLLEEVSSIISAGHREIVFDLKDVEKLDSLTAAWLVRVREAARDAGADVSIKGARGPAADFISFLELHSKKVPEPEIERKALLESLGEKGIAVWKEFRDASRLLVDTIYWSFIAPVEGRGVRWKSLTSELREMGYHAIGIVAMINFLLGIVIAMLSAAQLRMFGIQILVASAVVIGFARELAVVMTGTVVSARTGAAIAAELATMTVSEEIDALKGMGLNVNKFLIAPKVLAILISMPILTVIGFIAGVGGGFFVGLTFLGFNFERWWDQTIDAIGVGDLMQGMVKSFFFAMIIVTVGCHNGLRVKGGARGVGLVTTRAVVMDIFLIVVADMIFAIAFFYLT